MKKYLLAVALAISTLSFAQTHENKSPEIDKSWSIVSFSPIAIWSFRKISTSDLRGHFTFEMRVDYRPGSMMKGKTIITKSLSLIEASCDPQEAEVKADKHFDHSNTHVKDADDIFAKSSKMEKVDQRSILGMTLAVVCEQKNKTI